MKKDNKSDDSLLRQKAESIINKKISKAFPNLSELDTLKLMHELEVHKVELEMQNLSEIDTLKLIHELEVHQIELEMQNEELKITQENLKRTESQKWEAMISSSPDGIGLVSLDGKLQFMSDKLALIYGYSIEEKDGFIGHSVLNFIDPQDQQKIIGNISKLISGKSIDSFTEYLSVKKDNSRFYVELYSTLLLDSSGNPTNILYIARDITERKLANAKLFESNELLNSIVETAKDSIFIKDTSLRYIKVNDAMAALFGLEKEDLIGKSDAQLFGLESGMHIEESDRKALSGSTVEEFPSKPVNGEIKHFHTIKVPLKDANGKIKGLCGIARDITEHKEAEKALLESEKKYRNIFESVLDVYYEASLDGILLEISPSIEIVSKGQFNRFELIGKSFVELYADPEARNAFYKKLIQQGTVNDYELSFLNKDGSIVPVAISSSFIYNADGKPERITGSMRDITTRKLNEKALQKSEAMYRSILQASPDDITLTDLDGIIKMISPSALTIFGYEKEEEILGRHITDFVVPDDRERIFSFISKLQGDEQIQRGEYRGVRADRSIFDFEVNNNFVRDEAGQPNGLVCILHDITERKLSGMNLERSEERFRQVVELSNEVVWEVDADGLFTYVNNISTNIYGYTSEQLIGKWHFYDLHPEKEREKFKNSAFEIFRNKGKFIDLTNCIIKPDGMKVTLITNGIPMLDVNGDLIGYRGIDADITESLQAEEKLKQSEAALNHSQEIAKMGDWKLNLKTNQVTWSKNYYRLLGLDPDDKVVHAHIFYDLAHPEDKHLIDEKLREINVYRKPISVDMRLIMPDGQVKWIQNNIVPEFDGETLISLTGVNLDITEKKLAEKEILELNTNLELKIAERTAQLSESNKKLQKEIDVRKQAENDLEQLSTRLSLAARAGGVGVWDFDIAKNVLVWDEQMFALYGITKDEFTGAYDAWQTGLYPDDRVQGDLEIQMAISGEKEFDTEFRVVWPDGTIHYIRATAIVQRDDEGKPLRMIGTNWDITEQKRASDFANELLHLSIQLSGTPNAEINASLDLALKRIGGFLGADRAYIFELDISQNTMQNTYEWCNHGTQPQIENLQNIPCDMLPMWMGTLQRNENIIIPFVQDLAEGWKAEREILEPQGIQSLIVIPILNENQLIGFVGLDSVLNTKEYSTNEINNLKVWSNLLSSLIVKKRTEEALEQTRRNYETFFNTIDDFLFVLDEQGNIIHTNNTVNQRLEYTTEELMHQSVLMIHPPERRAEAGRIVGEMLAGTADFCPVPLIAKFGNYIAVETRVKPGFWNDKPVIFGVSKDVSKIKISEEKFSKAFQSNSALMAISNFENGTYYDVNEAFINTLGYSRDEIIDKNSTELEIFENPNIRKTIIEKIKEKNTVKEIELNIRTKSGKILTGLFSGDQIVIGDEMCLLSVLVDITERKIVEQALNEKTALLSDLLQSIPDMVFFKNIDGVYLGCNSEFARFTGKTIPNIVGSTDYDLFNKDVADFFREQDLIMMESGVARHNDEWITYPDNSEKFIDTYKAPLRDSDGHIFGLLGISRDITERRIAEEQIIKSKNEAEKANLAKSEFLSRMSHELRTPMNSILGFAQLMDMGELNPSHKKGVKHILNSGKHLLNLINEVLDISSIEAGRLSLSLEPIEIIGVIKQMLEVVQQHADEQQLHIEFSEASNKKLFVNADNQRLRQVLLNLLNNAIKYNNIGGFIIIKTDVLSNDTDTIKFVRISITDSGSGISPNYIPILFDPFERFSAEKSVTEGTGLGLAVVKKLMEAMGGNVGVDSTLEVGSTFWIEFPYLENHSSLIERIGNATNDDEAVTGKTGTILYIEDNMSNTELVQLILSEYRNGISLFTSINGMQTVQLAKEYKPDLILLDLDLPDIHGSEVLTNLKADEDTKSIPVVIITADAMPKQIERLMLQGARDYLTKPLNIKMFLMMVDEWINIPN
ncbi:MAG: PAS domain S-box protein [bacterium]